MIFAIKVDQNGVFIEDAFVEELTESTIETPCPAGFILPRWDGEQWIEGGTKPEPTPHEPTLEERLAAVEAATLDLILGGAL